MPRGGIGRAGCRCRAYGNVRLERDLQAGPAADFTNQITQVHAPQLHLDLCRKCRLRPRILRKGDWMAKQLFQLEQQLAGRQRPRRREFRHWRSQGRTQLNGIACRIAAVERRDVPLAGLLVRGWFACSLACRLRIHRRCASSVAAVRARMLGQLPEQLPDRRTPTPAAGRLARGSRCGDVAAGQPRRGWRHGCVRRDGGAGVPRARGRGQ